MEPNEVIRWGVSVALKLLTDVVVLLVARIGASAIAPCPSGRSPRSPICPLGRARSTR
jgi:hypothetical protein